MRLPARTAAGLAAAALTAGTWIVGGLNPLTAAAAADPVIAAAGDIACDPSDANFNNGAGTASFCRQRDTGALLSAGGYAAVLPLGDLQYTDATLAKLQQVYDPAWGATKATQRPVPGNHEYLVDGAAGYYDYYGAQAGERSKGWYSYDVGSWHLIALNGEAENCPHVSCSAGSEQETWLRADLAAHPAQCTLAYWHVPKFSSSAPENSPLFQTFWNDLYGAGVDVVLNGHFHNYERFAPQNASGGADANGIREFVVGTGGKGLVGFGSSPMANSQVRNSDTYGVLELALHNGSYDWSFKPIAGQAFTDSGSATCSGAAASSSPTPSITSPATTPPPTTPPPSTPSTPGPTTAPTSTSTPTSGSSPTASTSTTPDPSASASTSAPTSPDPSATPPPPSPGSTSPPPGCDPAMQLSSTDVPAGRAVDVTVSGVSPGTSVSLEGYTRPSTAYRQLRAATPAATDGTVRFTLQPTTNSRLRARIAGCPSPGTSQVLTVHAGLTLRVTRTGTRQYTFAGSILPAAANTGRQVTLFYRTATGAAVRRAVTAVRSDGTYSATVRFAGSARLTFFWQTGNNLVNAAATSPSRTVLVS